MLFDPRDKSYCPTLSEAAQYVKNPVFMQFCVEIKEKYKCSEKIEYSSCSLERGWNIKFKKKDDMYNDVFRLIDIRRNS